MKAIKLLRACASIGMTNYRQPQQPQAQQQAYVPDVYDEDIPF